MQVGILGFARSGKTTIFNAATRGSAAVSPTGRGGGGKPNIGVAKMHDPRIDKLVEMHRAPKRVPAEVVYVDMPGAPEGFGKSVGITGELLNHLQKCDALMLVARAFDDPSVPNDREDVDPARDIEAMVTEVVFSDLAILEKRLQRVKDSFKGAKATERDTLEKEQVLLIRIQGELEAGKPVKDQALTADERKALQGYKFLTDKPLVAIANIGEEALPRVQAVEEQLRAKFEARGIGTAAVCGKLEMELAQMAPEEEAEFRRSMSAGESGLNRMVRLCYDALGQLTFFTAGPKEVHAWTVARGSDAFTAAGRIHSDIQRGFIRAEIMGYEDFVACGSEAAARKRGLLRQEGKTYIVQDGDILNVLFSI